MRNENSQSSTNRQLEETVDMNTNEVHDDMRDGVENTSNEVLEESDENDGIETTPNDVYGIRTDGIEITLNDVYGIRTDGIETTPNDVYGLIITDRIVTRPKMRYME